MPHGYDALNVTVGLVLMAVTAYAAIRTLLLQVAPGTMLVDGSGTAGAVLTLGLFALGGYMVARGLLAEPATPRAG